MHGQIYVIEKKYLFIRNEYIPAFPLPASDRNKIRRRRILFTAFIVLFFSKRRHTKLDGLKGSKNFQSRFKGRR